MVLHEKYRQDLYPAIYPSILLHRGEIFSFKHIMRIYSIILIIALLSSCSSVEQQQSTTTTTDTAAQTIKIDTPTDKIVEQPIDRDQLIIPGQRIGHLTIGMDAAQATDLLKTPDESDAAMGKSVMTWYANHKKGGYQTSVYCTRNMGGKDESTSRIKKILVTSPFFKTAEGISVGSKQEAMREAFDLEKTGTTIINERPIVVYSDLGRGISFETDIEQDVCVGVIVHAKGEDANTYLNMRQ